MKSFEVLLFLFIMEPFLKRDIADMTGNEGVRDGELVCEMIPEKIRAQVLMSATAP